MAKDSERPRGNSGSAARSIASAGDRVRAFRSARRHSYLVRLLKLSLPLGALVALASYGTVLVATTKFRDRGIDPGTPKISTKNLTMELPKYAGVTKDGTRYEIRAREAITDLKMTGPIRLNTIDGDFFQLAHEFRIKTAGYALVDAAGIHEPVA